MKNYRALWARYLLGVDSFLLFQFSHSSCLLFLGWVCVLGLPSCRLSYLTSLFHAESVTSCAYFAAALSACPHCLGHTFQVIPPALPVVTHPQVSHLSARGYTAVPPGPLIPVSWHAPMPSVPHCIFLPLSQRSPCFSPMWPFFFSMIISLFFTSWPLHLLFLYLERGPGFLMIPSFQSHIPWQLLLLEVICLLVYCLFSLLKSSLCGEIWFVYPQQCLTCPRFLRNICWVYEPCLSIYGCSWTASGLFTCPGSPLDCHCLRVMM